MYAVSTDSLEGPKLHIHVYFRCTYIMSSQPLSYYNNMFKLSYGFHDFHNLLGLPTLSRLNPT